MEIKDLRNRVEYYRGIRDTLRNQLKEAEDELASLQESKSDASLAQVIVQEGAKRTQSQVQYRIGQLVSLAMESVFDNPYKVNLTFDSTRGKTAAKITFEQDGEEIDPLDASGGGAVDVAAFGLQASLYTLQNPKTRNLLILDEPLKWLKGGQLPDRGAAMLHQISHRLNLQIIMISHSPELIRHADRVFEVTKKDGVSCVKIKKKDDDA